MRWNLGMQASKEKYSRMKKMIASQYRVCLRKLVLIRCKLQNSLWRNGHVTTRKSLKTYMTKLVPTLLKTSRNSILRTMSTSEFSSTRRSTNVNRAISWIFWDFRGKLISQILSYSIQRGSYKNMKIQLRFLMNSTMPDERFTSKERNT